MIEKIGRNALGGELKGVYDTIEESLKKGQNRFKIPFNTTNESFMSVLNLVLGDNPDIIWAASGCHIMASVLGKQVVVGSPFSPQEQRLAENRLRAAADEAVREIERQRPADDYDALVKIYEYIQKNTVYDDAVFERVVSGRRSAAGSRQAYHNAYGALVEKKAVCDGLAAGVALLARRFGISCCVVSGEACNSLSDGYFNHSWNIVGFKRRYYHLDITWDLNRYEALKRYSYDYFCVDDDDIADNHKWNFKLTPACMWNDMNYYRKLRCYAGSLSQADSMILRQLKSGSKEILLKLDRNAVTGRNMGVYIKDRALSLASELGMSLSISYMWNEGVNSFYAKIN